MRTSNLERRMELLLRRRGLKYEREKMLPGLRFRSSLRCDFYLPPGVLGVKRAAIIEVDGPHHFMGDRLVATRDMLKNMYAIHHGLHFLRVDFSCATRFDLVLDEFLKATREADANTVKHTFAGCHYYK